MAQRTGTDGLIAPPVKVAGAGFILALATAALLAVSGCGGGSEAQTASAPRSATATQSTSTTDTTSPPETSSSPKTASGASSDAEGSKPGSGKQGPRVATPKGAPEPAPTQAQRAQAAVADVALSSPALGSPSGSASALPSTYTCEGKDSWPPLRWQGLPPGTAELVLFAMNVQPVGGKLFFDWALAGLDPTLEGIEAARLPKGTVSGRNGFGESGYSICPSGGEETYVFALYALPQKLSPRKGFDPHALREEVLQISGNVGLLAASYTRG